jgi:hypothetical protein
MSARITLLVGDSPIEITVRQVGACTCSASAGLHEEGCGVLNPGRIDLIVAEPVRAFRSSWWRRGRYHR